jgi:hypothetical protein
MSHGSVDGSCCAGLLFHFGTGDDLLIKGRDMHAKAPPDASEHMCPSGESDRQAINGGLIPAILHPADAALEVDPVQATILVTYVLSPDLVLGFEAPEVPVDIIRGTQVCTHRLILLRI